MDATMLAIAGLTLSVVAVLCAVVSLLRAGSLAKAVARLSNPAPARDNGEQSRRDLLARISEIDEQFNTMARQFDALQLSVSELELARRAVAPPPMTAPASPPAPSFEPEPVREPVTEPEAEITISPPPSPITVPAPPPAAPPAAAPEQFPEDRVDALIAGYRAKIAERSKAPIREWLSQNNSFALDAAEDGSLIPSETGLIAAIPIGDDTALLVPTAGFVVDFATRFAGSQISLRQVMRNTFEAVADNSGDMKLQSPALARRAGERWIVERPGRLGGFTGN